MVQQDVDNWDENSMHRWFRQQLRRNDFTETHNIIEPLSTVFEGSRELLEFTDRVKSEIWRPKAMDLPEKPATSSVPHLPTLAGLTTPCPTCQNLPPEQHCRREFRVDRVQNADQYKDAVLTEADPHDRLEPKVSFTLSPSRSQLIPLFRYRWSGRRRVSAPILRIKQLIAESIL
jgi:hypothetical protein